MDILDSSNPKAAAPSMLVVDLDHTLLRTDLLFEQLIIALKKNPARALELAFTLPGGRASFKARLAEGMTLRAAHLPYRQSVLDLIREEKRKGNKIVLASASHESLVREVANHLGLFDHVIGSNGTNLKGAEKLRAIQMLAGDLPFRYIGDSNADLKIWEKCQHAYAVNPTSAILRSLTKAAVPMTALRDSESRIKTVLQAIRVHHWSKNVLIFVPLIAGHFFFSPEHWLKGLLAFLAFSFLASSVYVFNDLLDLEADRQHAVKRNRPFAAGTLSITSGLVLFAALILMSALASSFLAPSFALILGAYLGLNLLYSFRLKREMVIDVVTLAALYSIRIIAGGMAMAIPVSQWLLAFSIFFFFGLAMLKRLSELQRTKEEKIHGRGYSAVDKPAVFAIGTISSMLSVLVLALYLNSAKQAVELYSNPERLWLVTPVLLYWISRMWILANRGEIHEDPVIYTLKDKTTWLVGAAFMAVLAWAAT